MSTLDIKNIPKIIKNRYGEFKLFYAGVEDNSSLIIYYSTNYGIVSFFHDDKVDIPSSDIIYYMLTIDDDKSDYLWKKYLLMMTPYHFCNDEPADLVEYGRMLMKFKLHDDNNRCPLCGRQIKDIEIFPVFSNLYRWVEIIKPYDVNGEQYYSNGSLSMVSRMATNKPIYTSIHNLAGVLGHARHLTKYNKSTIWTLVDSLDTVSRFKDESLIQIMVYGNYKQKLMILRDANNIVKELPLLLEADEHNKFDWPGFIWIKLNNDIKFIPPGSNIKEFCYQNRSGVIQDEYIYDIINNKKIEEEYIFKKIYVHSYYNKFNKSLYSNIYEIVNLDRSTSFNRNYIISLTTDNNTFRLIDSDGSINKYVNFLNDINKPTRENDLNMLISNLLTNRAIFETIVENAYFFIKIFNNNSMLIQPLHSNFIIRNMPSKGSNIVLFYNYLSKYDSYSNFLLKNICKPYDNFKEYYMENIKESLKNKCTHCGRILSSYYIRCDNCGNDNQYDNMTTLQLKCYNHFLSIYKLDNEHINKENSLIIINKNILEDEGW